MSSFVLIYIIINVLQELKIDLASLKFSYYSITMALLTHNYRVTCKQKKAIFKRKLLYITHNFCFIFGTNKDRRLTGRKIFKSPSTLSDNFMVFISLKKKKNIYIYIYIYI